MTERPADGGATVAALIERLCQRFEGAHLVFGHGFASAWDEAVALVLTVAGLPDDRSVLAQSLAPDLVSRIEALADRRVDERVPLAYLTGHSRFAGHDFVIEPGVVVPRSPLGELIVNRFAPWLQAAPRRIVDLCCGSGCIGIAAALAFADAHLDLLDVDPAALALARRNVALHGLEERAVVHRSNLFDDLPDGRWDLILSNPPYVNAVDMASLPPEYRHEPPLGLAGGEDGLDLVLRMLDGLDERLSSDGLFVCEVGASAPELLRRRPRLPFVWPELGAGGEGVFLLWGSAGPFG